ncbi:endonuclease domain-containing protein [Bythopirellula goksoeyrii]|uniref:DUF559 domain-containing protein n=1 Tax=Bythopirellula goksoeyrii TaxID=1400387 RepID=A0A5B9Q1D0_9BACT|nr:DUF559 domain-containing protein [Bythopirellula goksoeyrii]QEG32754.1 hypothetical protein Pr1d_00130 [Bythopirellula goksoeyrii]
MNPKPHSSEKTTRAHALRQQQTKSESLLWSLLRGGQLCNLKFRRQHPIGPYYADFACVAEQLVIEVDGGYHDAVGENDLHRETYLRECGWQILRFTDKDVEHDVQAVGQAIASHLGKQYDFKHRDRRGAGIVHESAPEGPMNLFR